jgi:iron uptake system component EfeO
MTSNPRSRLSAWSAPVAAIAVLTIALTACGSTGGAAAGSPNDGTGTSAAVSATTAVSSADSSTSSDVAGPSTAPGGSSSTAASGGDAPVKDGASQVRVTLQDNTCTLDFASAKAGPITFTVTNLSASGLTEVELLSDQRIVGEKENLAPGLPSVSFTSTVTGGTYQLFCPGADTEKQDFTVSGTAPDVKDQGAAALLEAGTKNYAQYVSGAVGDMVTAVENLQKAVDSGNVADARARYALARPFYEKIESDVEGFVLPGHEPGDNAGFLDYLVDMRASNLDPAVGWHGFHAIERDLFTGDGAITDSTRKLAAELLVNVKRLATLSGSLDYRPEDLANGAAALLEEVQTNKIKGEEEAFSHLDLVDMAANVEGAQQAFANLEPGLRTIDSALTDRVRLQFDAVNKALDAYRDPSQLGGFVRWTPEVRAKDAAGLSKIVQALQDPLSQIAQKVATV